MERNAYIAIEGVIGVGKTTLARKAQREFQAEILLEVFEENPFLVRFYQDRKRFGFQTQIFFLLSRYQQQHEAVPKALAKSNLITDYTFDKNLIFARLNLEGDELSMYDRVHAILSEKIPTPDLVVYLRADTEVLLERIALRDRAYERAIERDYIESLERAYDEFFAHYALAPVLTLDTNELDIVHRPEDLRTVVDCIRKRLETSIFQQRLL